MKLYRASTRFRELMNTYQLIASRHDLPGFLSIVSGTTDLAGASPAQMQLAIVALELGVAHIFRTWGIIPNVAIGHSLGEYATLCLSAVFSPNDALYLVGRRAALLEQHLGSDSHAMLATPMATRKLTACIQEERKAERLSGCSVACVNAPHATVASRTLSDVRALQDTLTGQSMRSTLLRVPFGSHSAQVEPILSEFEHIAAGIMFKKPIIPVASTLRGQLVDTDDIFDPSYLARQAREPVNFVGGLRALEAAGYAASTTLGIETDPDAGCLGVVSSTLDVDAACLCRLSGLTRIIGRRWLACWRKLTREGC